MAAPSHNLIPLNCTKCNVRKIGICRALQTREYANIVSGTVKLPKTIFEIMILQSQTFERQLMDQILLQLDESRDWMMTLGWKTDSEKVVSFLLLLSNHIDERDMKRPGKIHFELPITRSDAADFYRRFFGGCAHRSAIGMALFKC